MGVFTDIFDSVKLDLMTLLKSNICRIKHLGVAVWKLYVHRVQMIERERQQLCFALSLDSKLSLKAVTIKVA